MTATASLHPTPDTQGRSRLWSVFWLQGVIPSNILWAVALWAHNPNLGVAARGLTVAWGLNTVLVIFFLTLQLVAQ